jgi:hypothetical protein
VKGDDKAKRPAAGVAQPATARAKCRWGLRSGILITVLVLGFFLIMRQGVIPAYLSPLPALDIAVPNPWLVDWRIAELKRDRALCTRVLKRPVISASAVSDNPIKDGCGWTNAVRISNAGGASLNVGTVSCEVAAGIAMWIAHEVQPRAIAMLGARVTSVQHMGTYSCRNVLGRKLPIASRSQHATANALDISGFTLANGRQVTVARHWSGTGAEARFLREIHARACRYFRVAIGPEYNALHKDHFHYDRGLFSRCK